MCRLSSFGLFAASSPTQLCGCGDLGAKNQQLNRVYGEPSLVYVDASDHCSKSVGTSWLHLAGVHIAACKAKTGKTLPKDILLQTRC